MIDMIDLPIQKKDFLQLYDLYVTLPEGISHVEMTSSVVKAANRRWGLQALLRTQSWEIRRNLGAARGSRSLGSLGNSLLIYSLKLDKFTVDLFIEIG